jgi:hypothetical protein
MIAGFFGADLAKLQLPAWNIFLLPPLFFPNNRIIASLTRFGLSSPKMAHGLLDHSWDSTTRKSKRRFELIL